MHVVEAKHQMRLVVEREAERRTEGLYNNSVILDRQTSNRSYGPALEAYDHTDGKFALYLQSVSFFFLPFRWDHRTGVGGTDQTEQIRIIWGWLRNAVDFHALAAWYIQPALYHHRRT